MTDNKLISFFPQTESIKSIRINQLDALNKLGGCIERGDKKITLEAPTGAGKSAIADTIFNYYNEQGISCLYTSPLNTLVDQVENSGFENIVTLKGRVHYPCLAGKENCGKGFCTIKKCPSGTHKRDCKGKPYDGCGRCVCWRCIYKAAFRKFKECSKGNTNFTLFMMDITNNPSVIVFDEADKIEDTVRDFRSVTIPILINKPEFIDHIEPLTAYYKFLDEEANKINPDESDEKAKKREALRELSSKIIMLLEDFENNDEPWCISVKTISQKTHYQPITITRFLEPLLKDKIVVMMSATPPTYPGYSKIEVDSIFPIETRQWQYKPLGRMSMNYRSKTIPKLAAWLNKLRGKTLVHCVSYKTAEAISIPLKMLGINPYIQVPGNGESNNGNVTRYDAVKAFVESTDSNKIMLSVKLDRGVDFWQPDILNNVIAVLPWPNPIDPLTKAKDKLLGDSWHNEKIAQDIMQAYGRIHRNEKMGMLNGIKVPKKTYIIDSNFGFWYTANKKYFTKWFKESQLKGV